MECFRWIECLFKDLKRGGLGWHHTKMTDPQRAERLWLAIAVATLWVVSLGGKADGSIRENGLSLIEPSCNDGDRTTPADSGSSHQRVHAASQTPTSDFDRSLQSQSNEKERSLQSQSNHFPLEMEINFYTFSSSSPGLSHRSNQPRWLSCFRHGVVRLLAALIKGETLPPVGLIPDYSLETG